MNESAASRQFDKIEEKTNPEEQWHLENQDMSQ